MEYLGKNLGTLHHLGNFFLRCWIFNEALCDPQKIWAF